MSNVRRNFNSNYTSETACRLRRSSILESDILLEGQSTTCRELDHPECATPNEVVAVTMCPKRSIEMMVTDILTSTRCVFSLTQVSSFASLLGEFNFEHAFLINLMMSSTN
ncbi:hypothetical protein CDAR_281431 [Caerostris darwini]|uniref:Uncharacterized protein n=1 Tax=Caerostris darwini TaxID=1538125 RepID=A0AAV4TGM1_9ARAC|nr:hypothetical protein CDAR_281431 [Caerostris darwini]